MTGGPGTVPLASSITVRDAILYRALRLAGITRGPGRTAAPEQFNDALVSLNALMDTLSIQRGAIYTVRFDSYTLSPPKTSYTIGIDPAGLQTADFPSPRPARIERANIILTTSPTLVYVHLRIVGDREWARISVRQIPVTIPQLLYCDYAYPLASLFLWGYPSQNNKLELWTWQALKQFTSITDNVIVPPGYLDMLVYGLAVRLADQFPELAQMSPNVALEARRMLSRVKSINLPAPEIASADYGAEDGTGTNRGPAGGGFNYMTGGPA